MRALVLCVLLGLFAACHTPEGGNPTAAGTPKGDSLLYLNHADSARYVGINTCKLCHQEIYNSFIKTGMGKSFDHATRQKSSGDFKTANIYDKFLDFHYRAYWKGDSLHMLEYRLDGRDTTYRRDERVDYIIGSGQHTNSHIQSVNGYLNQMPMTFYTQKHQWDLPPGFENGMNSRFSRKIGLECMSCHNAYPEFVLGSENKFSAVPEGINCERCHGPGSIHVNQRSNGSRVDTSRYIDYSIVNPAKLSIDAQFDICQRCHLQGNAILKEGKSFYDFRPGMKLSNYISVFLPKYKHADEDFIMASHADRLKQSQCFIQSVAKAKGNNSLKPYKDAMTCVTCHNPHVSVRETNKEVFNDACNSCHHSGGKSALRCTDKNVVLAQNAKAGHAPAKFLNCVNCHMPSSGSTDIPHVSVHDHYIRKPVTKKDKDALKTFIGLYAINEKNPDRLTRARAYLNQFEKFEMQAQYLDSAALLLGNTATDATIEALVQLQFARQDFKAVIAQVTAYGAGKLLDQKLTKTSYDNQHAWTAYRIGESYTAAGEVAKALPWLEKAVKLAPYYMEFKNKLGACYANNNAIAKAKKEWTELLDEYPKHVAALNSMGYLSLAEGDLQASKTYFNRALKLDPDYEPLLLNVAGYYASQKDYKAAVAILQRILKKNPNNEKARLGIQQLGHAGM